MLQNPQSYKYKLPSDHTLMTSFVHFNQKRDRFITCGEDGQIHVYRLAKDQGILKIGYANLFDEVVVCVKWATPTSGGFVAVGGSKGSLVILSVDQSNGMIVIHKYFNFGPHNVPHSIDWHPQKPLLLMGTVNGYCYTISSLFAQQWASSAIPYSFDDSKEVLVSFGIPGTSYQFAAVGETLYQLEPKNEYIKQVQLQGQKILALMSRTQSPQKYLELYVLTNKKLRIYEANNPKEMQATLKKIQQINVSGYNCDQMSWGWSQSEIVLYSTSINNLEKLQKSENYLKCPILLKRKLNGKLVLADN